MRLRHRFDGPDGAPVLVLANSLGTTLEMWDAERRRVDAERARAPLRPPRARRLRRLRPARTHSSCSRRDALALLDELGDRARVLLRPLARRRGRAVARARTRRSGSTGSSLAAPRRASASPTAGTSEPSSSAAEGMEAIADAVARALVHAGRVRASSSPPTAPCSSRPRRRLRRLRARRGGWDFRDRLGEIRADTLVIAGADDPADAAVADSELIADGVPSARLVVLEHARAPRERRARRRVLRARRRTRPIARGGRMSDEGMRIRREVLGDEHVDRAIERTTE